MEGRLYDWNYDYSKTMWLKMYMAEPDFPNNRSLVYITYERALDIFRVIDNLTQGIRKIVYLVGWQGLGHDDCYPDMDELNEALKRPCDATARESLFWLYNEAKKYNTVVSFHVNLADAYGASKSCPELIAAAGVAKNPDGTPAVIDKDFASAKLAELVDADMLIILTAVEKVAVNFGKPDEQSLDRMSLDDVQRYTEEGQFAKGSMLPKVDACAEFVAKGRGRKAVIADLMQAGEAVKGNTGTVIEN